MSARTAFDIAQEHGFHFDLLDIGGGFPGQSSAKLPFEEVLIVFHFISFISIMHDRRTHLQKHHNKEHKIIQTEHSNTIKCLQEKIYWTRNIILEIQD
jgi:hypothetical protein